MSAIYCPISLGELLDKISILQIKMIKIIDPNKVEHVNKELQSLLSIIDNSEYHMYIHELRVVNDVLWDVEELIRKKELKQEFDDDFIQLARKVYLTNDKRFSIKALINDTFSSTLKEQKSYNN